jgi:hypothetical protein
MRTARREQNIGMDGKMCAATSTEVRAASDRRLDSGRTGTVYERTQARTTGGQLRNMLSYDGG